jgi:hypothetical protein
MDRAKKSLLEPSRFPLRFLDYLVMSAADSHEVVEREWVAAAAHRDQMVNLELPVAVALVGVDAAVPVSCSCGLAGLLPCVRAEHLPVRIVGVALLVTDADRAAAVAGGGRIPMTLGAKGH